MDSIFYRVMFCCDGLCLLLPLARTAEIGEEWKRWSKEATENSQFEAVGLGLRLQLRSFMQVVTEELWKNEMTIKN